MWHLVVFDLKSRHAALMTSILSATNAGDLHPGEIVENLNECCGFLGDETNRPHPGELKDSLQT